MKQQFVTTFDLGNDKIWLNGEVRCVSADEAEHMILELEHVVREIRKDQEMRHTQLLGMTMQEEMNRND